MDQPIVFVTLISVVGLLGIVSAVANWDWIYRTGGARLLTAVVGRPAMRVLTGITGLLMLVGPWLLLVLAPEV